MRDRDFEMFFVFVLFWVEMDEKTSTRKDGAAGTTGCQNDDV